MAEVHKIKITVLKRLNPQDVFEKSPVTPVEPIGQEFITRGGAFPEGFPCTTAWFALYSIARTLSFGGNMPWYKEEGVAIICCPDGLRPVIFKVERIP